MDGFLEDIATGVVRQKLKIAGRPRAGTTEEYLLLEEPDEPVQMHWMGRQVPHFKSRCPHCEKGGEIRPFWYIGALDYQVREFVIVELTWRCYRAAESAAAHLDVDDCLNECLFRGLEIKIKRPDFQSSPRALRCDTRRRDVLAWPYHTRLELARIWGIPTKPKIYQEHAS